LLTTLLLLVEVEVVLEAKEPLPVVVQVDTD
jgi:hypothetical protein